MNVARNTTNSRLFLVVLFSFLSVAVSGAVAVGDLLVAPNRTWKQLTNVEKKAMNEVMIEFDAGASGARKLLDEVRAGNRLRPSQLSDEVIEAYRDSVQSTVDRLRKTHPDKEISVMLDRLEIYRIWLGQ